jgi:2',3'-cyclic-nucleotide 2'-phosphodiesterase (5'-nucleotidase family)
VRKSIHLLSLFAFILLLPAFAGAQQASLTILHTNDTHSHLLPFSYPATNTSSAGMEGMKYRRDIGGIARRATLAKRLREELAAKGTQVLLIDAGDYTDGTPFSAEYHGEADVAAMNATGYDYAAIGNHELNQPLAGLKKLLGQFTFPILCANATETATGKLLGAESIIRQVGPLKIGFFGLITKEAKEYPAAKEGLVLGDELETALKMVKKLRAEADIVIAISHAGENVDNILASKVDGLDVIIGGHSHTRLPSGGFVWRSDDLKAEEVNGTIIVQDYQWGGELGRIDLLFAKDPKGAWHVERYRARLIPITSAIPEDEKVAKVVDGYWKPIAARYGEVLGTAEDDFTVRGDDLAPYNLVADLVRESAATEIDFENIGGVRSPFIKGDITFADLINADPFENEIMTFHITGKQLKDILVRGRPAVSGLRYRLEGRQLIEVSVGGRPVEDDRVYFGSTNSYFASRTMKGIEFKNSGKMRRDVIKEMLRKKGSVKPVYDGRRVVVGLNAAEEIRP